MKNQKRIICNIHRGWDKFDKINNKYRQRLLYAEVIDESGKLYCCATLGFILRIYYKNKNVTNYENALIKYIDFNTELIKSKNWE